MIAWVNHPVCMYTSYIQLYMDYDGSVVYSLTIL